MVRMEEKGDVWLPGFLSERLRVEQYIQLQCEMHPWSPSQMSFGNMQGFYICTILRQVIFLHSGSNQTIQALPLLNKKNLQEKKNESSDCFSTYKYLLTSLEIPSSPIALHEAYPSLQQAQCTSADLHYLKVWAFVHEWNTHYFFNNTEIISIILDYSFTWSA